MSINPSAPSSSGQGEVVSFVDPGHSWQGRPSKQVKRQWGRNAKLTPLSFGVFLESAMLSFRFLF